MKSIKIKILIFVTTILFLSGCNLISNNPEAQQSTITSPTTTSDKPITSEPTPSPLPEIVYVAFVNESGIPLASFQASLIQFNLALVEYPDLLKAGQSAEQIVINDLLYRQILADAAYLDGYEVSSETLLEELNQLTLQAGGEESLNIWFSENGYSSKKDFLYDLSVEMAASIQRKKIFESVPTETEQVLAHQLFFNDAYLASRAYDQLSAGADWEIVQNSNDPFEYGYLGWFPRGYLLIPEIEEVAFTLLPGAFSEIIETELGYHILYILDKEENAPLSADALLKLKEISLTSWLEDKFQSSQIEFHLPEN